MPRSTTILPPSSSDLEVDLLDVFIDVMQSKLQSPNVPIKFLWNPDECPVAFLPYLACAFSVDGEISDFTATQLRELIRNSLEIHLKKGTVWSVKQVIESLGYQITEFVEGDRDVSNNIIRTEGRWAHFAITIDTAISQQQALSAARLIQSVAPVSRKLVRMTYESTALRYNGGIQPDGTYTFRSDGTHQHGRKQTFTIVGNL